MKTITYAQFVKMLVTSIGYDFYSEAVGGYPNGYFKYAENFNITDDINLNMMMLLLAHQRHY